MTLMIEITMTWVRYDAVTYLKYLDSLRVSESFRSVWIFAESSYKIFEYAKKRVYLFTRSEVGKPSGQSNNVTGKRRKSKENNDDKEASDGGVLLQEVLEEAPKWKALRVSESVPFFFIGHSRGD